MNAALNFPSTLILNADYSPLSVAPLSVWAWEDVVHGVLSKTLTPVTHYKDIFVSSPSVKLPLPSVAALTKYISLPDVVPFTRFNVMARDNFRCAYCGSENDLTYDHIIPRCKGGKTTWDNIVTACSPCNLRKGHFSLKEIGYTLRTKPREPTQRELMTLEKLRHRTDMHADWRAVLWLDAELEP